jgi:hypothetical protein
MVEALKRQVRLLESYLGKAPADPDYWGEVAGKLRLLVIDGGSNKALLLRVAEKYDAILGFHPEPGNYPKTWGALLDTPMFTRGEQSITMGQLIRGWAEQLGAAHEDWAIDELLLATQRDAWITLPNGKRIALAHSNLVAIALRVIETARYLLDGIGALEEMKADNDERRGSDETSA